MTTAQKIITLQLDYPPSVNHYWRRTEGHKTAIGDKGIKYRQQTLWRIHQARGRQIIPHDAIVAPVAVSVEAWAPDRIRRDLDNLWKALLDSLTHAKLWLDDSQIRDQRIRWAGYHPGGAIRFSMWELEQAEVKS